CLRRRRAPPAARRRRTACSSLADALATALGRPGPSAAPGIWRKNSYATRPSNTPRSTDVTIEQLSSESNPEIGDLLRSGRAPAPWEIRRSRGTRFPCERNARSHSACRHLLRVLPIQGVAWDVVKERSLHTAEAGEKSIRRERRAKGMIMAGFRAAAVALLAFGSSLSL